MRTEHGDEENMLRFDEMWQQGLQPNVITYNAGISACENGGMAERASRHFDKMQGLAAL